MKREVDGWIADGSIASAPAIFLAAEKETHRVLKEYEAAKARRTAAAKAGKVVSTPTITRCMQILILRLVPTCPVLERSLSIPKEGGHIWAGR